MAPFPYMPMIAIMATLVSDMVSQMSMLAYVGFMVEYLGVVDDKDEAGYYAGLLSAAFMIGRVISSHFWGLVSDRYGCRLVTIFGLSSCVVLSLAFGVSTSFAWAITLRIMVGLLSGTTAACKTLVSDVCGKEHETVGMGVVTAAWSLGQVLGPGVGGILAEPAKQHPQTFSENGIFGRNPYLLPNVAVAGFALSSLPLVTFFVKETKRAGSEDPTAWAMFSSWFCCNGGGNRDNKDIVGAIDDDGATDPAAAIKVASELPIAAEGTRVPSWMQPGATSPIARRDEPGYDSENLERDAKDLKPKSLLLQHHIRVLLVIDSLHSAAYSGFDAVYTLWILSTVAKGGLEWPALDIGKVFFACGLMLLAFEFFAMPKLTTQLGVRFCQRLGSVIEVTMYFVTPLLSYLNNDGVLVRVVAPVLLFAYFACSDTFCIGISLAINNATGSDRRGELNGISNTTGSLMRAISPVLFSAVFAFSISGNLFFPFDYNLAFYLLGLVRLTTACMGWNRVCDNGGVGSTKMMFGE